MATAVTPAESVMLNTPSDPTERAKFAVAQLPPS
jgi:hypothetical protein